MATVKSYPFKFSFVMPVYNVERYLDETIQSILNQTLSFKDNCEIIFVNDGSPDNVEELCLKYKNEFPNNIKYIKQKNSGVSVARNNGLDVAEGEFISFLDSDDLLSRDTLESVYRFFADNSEDIDVVSIKMQFFEAVKRPHVLNYKYHSDRIIDVNEEYDSIQLSASSAFIRSSAVKDKYTFDSRLTVTEDAVLINQIILDKMKYGIVAQPTYYYRRRRGGGSAINNSNSDKRWYTNTPVYAYKYLIDRSIELLGYVPRYIQFLVMYDIQWRFKQEKQDVLSSSELKLYKERLTGLLDFIDDDIIVKQRHLDVVQKLFVLKKKHGVITNDLFTELYLEHTPPAWIEFISVEKDIMKLDGRINYSLNDGYSLYFQLGSETYEAERVMRPKSRTTFLGEEAHDGGGYIVDINMQPGVNLKAYLMDDKGNTIDVPLDLKRYAKIAPVKCAYRVVGKYILLNNGTTICVRKNNIQNRTLFEIRWLVRILVGLKLRYAYELYKSNSKPGKYTKLDKARPFLIPIKAILQNIESVGYRCITRIFRKIIRKPVWIISDRTTAAGDNGEALFVYLTSLQNVPADVYFAISKKSPDYNRLKQQGKVLGWGSAKYKLLFLVSSKIISSHGDDFIVNPFGTRVSNFVDLMNFDYVFLQHGIIKDDLSTWLNRYNKNISLFVTSAKPEYESIVNGNYNYSEDQVILTGLPRYDLLTSEPKNKIIVAPTWRSSIADDANQRTGTRGYDKSFKKTEYFTFYQSLLADKRIIKKLEEKDITMEFYLHPSHAKQVKDYSGSQRVTIMKMPYSYKKAFSEGNILVTDYSSVAFDFAYLKKPVLYTQFDREEFFKGHLYEEGYFSYEDNGFGPVAYNYEDTVQGIIELIDMGMAMPDKYEKRLKKFFYKFDKNNSERVYKEILKLDKRKS